MIKLGLIGYPLSHSLSAVIQTAALKSVNLQGTYELLETPPENLVDRVKFLKTNDYTGFNITIPLKVPITVFTDSVDEMANVVGCVNTIKITPDKKMQGFNTDVYGFANAIDKYKRMALRDKKAVVLGTGGAARACGIALLKLGLGEIDFYSRNILNSTDMINFLRGQFPNVKINLKHYNSLENLSDTAMVVNTTPIGMKSFAMNESLLSVGQLKTLPPEAIVYDIVYNPIETQLIKDAKKCDLQTINGLDMLVHQAAKSFEIWTGKVPDFDKMKIAALESLLQ